MSVAPASPVRDHARRGWCRGVLALPLAPVVALHMAHRVCHPAPAAPHHTPARFRLFPREIRIPHRNGLLSLAAWVCQADPQRVVILGHGLGQEKSHALSHARMLHRAGFTVVLFDFRNHGGSTRDHGLTRFLNRYVEDVRTVVDHVRSLPEHAGCRIVLYGFSLATFAMLQSMTLPGGAVDAAVFDGGPALSVPATARRMLSAGALPLPAIARGRPTRDAVQALFGQIGRVTMGTPAPWPPPAGHPVCDRTPMLFVSGTADPIVPTEEARRLARPYARAELLVIPQAGHLQTMAMDRELYRGTVLEFLDRSLTTQEGHPDR
ncbi:alpha/beta hydrolase [Streptomyces sp. NPDC047082]|uniref:alpha/beta hydrolase n=1 Tax=Streptomyces sp. NPDC047082 TaxID=3155259 RepID=UPI0033EC4C20